MRILRLNAIERTTIKDQIVVQRSELGETFGGIGIRGIGGDLVGVVGHAGRNRHQAFTMPCLRTHACLVLPQLEMPSSLSAPLPSLQERLAENSSSKRSSSHECGGDYRGNNLGQHHHVQPFESGGNAQTPSRQRHFECNQQFLDSAAADDYRCHDSLSASRTILISCCHLSMLFSKTIKNN